MLGRATNETREHSIGSRFFGDPTSKSKPKKRRNGYIEEMRFRSRIAITAILLSFGLVVLSPVLVRLRAEYAIFIVRRASPDTCLTPVEYATQNFGSVSDIPEFLRRLQTIDRSCHSDWVCFEGNAKENAAAIRAASSLNGIQGITVDATTLDRELVEIINDWTELEAVDIGHSGGLSELIVKPADSVAIATLIRENPSRWFSISHLVVDDDIVDALLSRELDGLRLWRCQMSAEVAAKLARLRVGSEKTVGEIQFAHTQISSDVLACLHNSHINRLSVAWETFIQGGFEQIDSSPFAAQQQYGFVIYFDEPTHPDTVVTKLNSLQTKNLRHLHIYGDAPNGSCGRSCQWTVEYNFQTHCARTQWLMPRP